MVLIHNRVNIQQKKNHVDTLISLELSTFSYITFLFCSIDVSALLAPLVIFLFTKMHDHIYCDSLVVWFHPKTLP